MEVRNRFKGLDFDRVPEELWMEVHDIVQEAGSKTIPQKKKCKKAKWLSEETLQIAVKRSEKQRRKGKIYPFECELQRIARRGKKALHSNQCKQIEKKIESERLEISSRKLEIPREHFM